MTDPPTPSPTKEQAKRRRERWLIALTLLLVVGLTSMEVYLVRRGGHPVTGSLLAFGLLNLNTILFLLFGFLLFRNLNKLFLERRQKVFGSRLRTRLVLTFLSLALLPTLFLFFIAWQLISSRVDYQWQPQVEEALEQALELGRTFSQGLEEKLRACGRLFSRELEDEGKFSLEDGDALKDFLSQRRVAYQLTGLEVLEPNGARALAASYEAKIENLPAVPVSRREDEPLPAEALYRQATPRGELLSFLVPLKDALGDFHAYLVVRQLIPRSQQVQVAGAQRRVQDLRQMQMLLRPVRVSHYLTLVIVTLLVLMSATWLAFYLAREITTPIRQLAEGAQKVAGGHFDFQIATEGQEGKDEISFLVQSFNKMTQDLHHSQAQLAAAYRALSDSHQELAAQKRHIEILLKNVAAGVIGIDAAGRVTSLNDSAAQMLRLNREEVLGQDCRALVPAGEFQRLAEVIAAARHSRGPVETPFQLNLPDRSLYLLLKPTILTDETGQDLGVVVVFEDLTELERLQRLAAWREVARRIAHEVKNPLTPIKLAAQRLRRRYLERFGEDGRVFDECTQTIISQVDELKNLVNEFSQFGRLPSLSPTPQDLNELIRETLQPYRELQPRITFTFEADPGLPLVLLDREQMKRVLFNLVDNALASLTAGGSITLTLKGEPAANRVELVVADTGRGITDRDKARIFEPYFSTKRGGTGLGLAIVQSIIQEHQGQIRVEDNLPQGSRFIIELPLMRGEDAGHAAGSG